jgi:hypothetical protein
MVTMTRYGRAVSESGINPDEAIMFYEDLRQAQDSLNMEFDLHLIYLITPFMHSLQPDFVKIWGLFQRSREKKTPFFTVSQILEIDEGSLFKWQHTPVSRGMIYDCTNKLRLSKVASLLPEPCAGLSGKETTTLCRVKRLWAAMALCDVFSGSRNTVYS